MKVLFLCTGNICRSPMAEALARKLLDGRGRTDIEVASAGTAAAEGASASEGAYLVGMEQGLDLSGHTGTQLTAERVGQVDLILGMSTHHVYRAEMLGGRGKSHLLGTYAGRDGEHAEVEDPFGGDLEDYRTTYDRLASLVADAIERMVREQDAGAGDQ